MYLLTVPEVAERIRVSPELVRRWLRQGRLRGVRLGGTRLGWRILDAELERFLTSAGLPVADDRPPKLGSIESPPDPATATRHSASDRPRRHRGTFT